MDTRKAPDGELRQLGLWMLAFLGGLAALLALAAAILYFSVEVRLQRTYAIAIDPLPIPEHPASIARGRHLVRALAGCQDCHGEDLGGAVVFSGRLGDQVVASNLTAGEGGIGGQYLDEDWIRAIRHGVGLDGKPLVYVSSKSLYNLSDEDLGAIIAYLKSLPPVARRLPETSVGLLSRWQIWRDASLLPAEVIEHQAPRQPAPLPEVSAEYGRYLTIACRECHGLDLTGKPSVAAGGRDLTASGNLANWTETDFIRTLRTGVTPEGDELDPALMPWKRIGQLSDEELRAIGIYLRSITPEEPK